VIKAAVLGSPIEHSLSPLLHNTAYKLLEIQGEYSAVEVDAAKFPSYVESSLTENWSGFSLTMPLKESALMCGFETDERSLRIGSTNTLIRNEDSYIATSTDLLAFDRILDGLNFSSVAIIGGGGTARAAMGALDGLVSSVDVLVRDQSRSQQISSALISTQFNLVPMSTSLSDYDLVISTTPKGATDQIAGTIDEVNGTLIEALYDPLPTPLLRRWKELGGSSLDGLDLLVEQALDQIRLMSGQHFDYAQMRVQLLETVRAAVTMKEL
jgi:shikimate dehydrogenase